MPITTLPLDHLLSSTDLKDFPARRALSDVSVAVAKARKVVVVSGAGISCSSGIPDFRSADGLYSLVKARYPDAFVTGKDLFSSGLFSNPATTSLFYTFIAELSLSCAKAQPTRTHHFINKLEQKGKLLRSYTQNVDGLERRIGLESGGRGMGLKKKGTRNVELHGDLGRVRCVLCMKDYEAKRDWVELFREGEAPDCPACEERSASRVSRSARALPIGTLRPSIVLYDEPHPLGDDIGLLQTYDLSRQPDLMLIMGTSLKVHGLKRLVKDFAKAIHGKKGGMVVFVNATPPSKEWEGVIDYHVHGQTDVWVERVEEEWRRMRPGDWETQTLLDGEVKVLAGVSAGLQEKGKSKAKEAGKRATKAPRNDKENVPLPPMQFPPTPRNSQSPHRKQSPTKATSSDNDVFSSSPLTPASLADECEGEDDIRPLQMPSRAPPTPLSPSKRRNGVQADPQISPNKKSKSVLSATNPPPPTTGLPPTPGRGNLFMSPLKAKSTITLGDRKTDDEIFGSLPNQKVAAKAKTGAKAITAGAVAVTVADKENVRPTRRRQAAVKS